MKKVYFLAVMLFLVFMPFSDAIGQFIYYQGSFTNDCGSRFYVGYERAPGSHLYGRHHHRYVYFGSQGYPGYSAQYYRRPYTSFKNPYFYSGPHYTRRRIVEDHYYGYPNYPYAPSPRATFRPFYNVK